MKGKHKDLSGQIFRRLTALEYIGSSRWLCKCRCGNLVTVIQGSLHSGNTSSCGCYAREQRNKANRFPYGEAAFNILYDDRKTQAEMRKIVWKISKNEAKNLFTSNCFYCGDIPKQVQSGNRIYGKFIYNGIDRLNPELGYTLDNCVPCCKKCNYAKHVLTFPEFKNHVIKIHKYLNLGEKE